MDERLRKFVDRDKDYELMDNFGRSIHNDRLIRLITMLTDKGELPIAVGLASAVRNDVEELSAALISLFDSKNLLPQLLFNIFMEEVQRSKSLATLMRGNNFGSKTLTLCCKYFGSRYLHNLLRPLILPTLADSSASYEVNPDLIPPGGDMDRNRANLKRLSVRVLDGIVLSIDSFPPKLRMVCSCLYQALSIWHPCDPEKMSRTVGGIIFLRFINPFLLSPRSYGIVEISPRIQRGLLYTSKILQNVANCVDFNKEPYMMYFNSMLRQYSDRYNIFFMQISSDKPTSTTGDLTTPRAPPFTRSHEETIRKLVVLHEKRIFEYLEDHL